MLIEGNKVHDGLLEVSANLPGHNGYPEKTPTMTNMQKLYVKTRESTLI